MLEIDDEDYLEVLNSIFQKKISTCRDDSEYKCKQKAFQYCISRGYESNLVYELA